MTMDAIRVSKVEQVACIRSGTKQLGTVHLTAHHLIFRFDDEAEKEMWVPYPIISLVSCLPQTLQGQCPVNFYTRTFETFLLSFPKEIDAINVFESVKELTVATSVTQLYAFFYNPNPPLTASGGWSIYSPRDEFGRMGVGSRSKAWRFTDINKDYSFCPTYPARLVVPTRISDTTLQYASKYRSKCRIPVLSYLHWANYGSITRSSQPMVGITQNRSIQDEKLIEAIFQSHISPDTRASNSTIYGATATNLIIDARPTANAMANTAKGAGTENMEHYKEGKKAYLGIDHIHAMRESLAKVVEALREADTLLASINNDLPDQATGLSVLDRGALRRSGWLRHISAILEGTLLITRNVHVNSSHVLVHCSDGWDRTSQLSALSQLCLDPFYRTIRGFEILVEKDWLSYGHKFLDRCGHLSSEKFFLSSADTSTSASGAEAFLASVQNRFASQQHVKETSPVFHQWLESVRQVQRQFPERFEFNERFLHQLYYHLYSCQFGTFMFNCERERKVGDGTPPPCERTVSVWDFLNTSQEMELNRNPIYDPSLDDPTSRAPGADMGVLSPNPKDVRFWHEIYGRTDEEMNGRPFGAQQQMRGAGVELVGPIQNLEDDPGNPSRADTPSMVPLPASPSSSKSPPLVQSMGFLNLQSEAFRDTLPGTGEGSSSSSPEVRGSPARTDSPLVAPSPDISQRPGRLPSPSPQTPLANRMRLQKPDFLPSSGVKSIWGKLSSNASAALSAVQDTYASVAKDLRAAGGGENTEELRGRDTLTGWGEDDASTKPAPPSRDYGSYSTMNPWASSDVAPSTPSSAAGDTSSNTGPSRSSSTSGGTLLNVAPSVPIPVSKEALPNAASSISPSALGDNPWNSSSAPRREAHTDTSHPSTGLPLDPTVAHPMPRAISSRSATSLASNASSRNQRISGVEDRVVTPPPDMATKGFASSNTDPLGVGLL